MSNKTKGTQFATAKTGFIRKVLFVALALGCVPRAHAYTVVTVSTNAAPGLESAFINSTTAQWLGSVSVNPFFQGTYSLQLTGPNPSYDPPITKSDLLNALVTVDSYTYTDGWADGVDEAQYQDQNIAGNLITMCSSPSAWNVAIDSTTCYVVLGIMENAIYNESLSTPTVTPGNFQ